MPSRTTRKVGELGIARTPYITIPRDFANFNFTKGETVTLLYDGVLIVCPKGTEELGSYLITRVHRCGGGR